MPDNVTLIIKAANQSVPDQQVLCDSNWTVSALKAHIASVHPAKPRVDEQRLIYSGQLLADNLVLHNILRHPTENNAYTIHLVCSPPRYTPQQPVPSPTTQKQSPQRPSTLSANQRRSPEPPSVSSASQRPSLEPPANNRASVSTNQGEMSGSSQEANSPAQPDTPVNNEATDGVRRRNVTPASEWTPQSIDAASTYPTQQLPFTALQASAGPMQQMVAMQQMYANYMAYIQYMQMGGVVSGLAWPQQMVQLPTTATATPTPTTPDVVDPPQAPLDQIQPPEPQPQQPPPQIRMNAQGVEVDEDDEDEGMGRDWLDWIYVLSRMLVLLSVVYFYSTLSRFMVVVCIAMLLYLYQAGWFRPARRIDQPQPANPDDQNNNNNNNIDQLRQADDDDANDNEGDDDQSEDAQPEPEENNTGISNRVIEEVPVRPSILALSWTFLTTFFTSLIPEQPQGI